MAEAPTTRRWAGRTLFALLALGAVTAAMLPLGDGTGGLPGPDLPTVLAFAWILRRPSYVPALLLAMTMLLADMVTLRPLGLWAGLVVLGGEFLRSRESLTRDMPLPFEWALVATVLAGISLLYWAVLTVFVVPQPGLGPLLLRALVSAAAYPLVVLASAGLFGIRKAAPGAVDALGHRL